MPADSMCRPLTSKLSFLVLRSLMRESGYRHIHLFTCREFELTYTLL